MKTIKVTALLLMLQMATESKAQVNVSKPAGLGQAVASRTSHRKNPNTRIKGYQILIYSGSSRSKAESIKSKFDAEFKQFSEVVWDEPNFKVYVGAFTSKFECMRFLEEIKGRFETAILFSSTIPYTPIN